MNRRTGYVVAAAMASLTLGIFLFQRDAAAQRSAQYSGPETARAPVGPPPPRWEYATLRFDIVKGDWVWTTQTDVKRGDKRKLLKELGGYGQRGDHDVSYVDIASQAGLYGWELSTVLEREKGTEIWFKRPVR